MNEVAFDSIELVICWITIIWCFYINNDQVSVIFSAISWENDLGLEGCCKLTQVSSFDLWSSIELWCSDSYRLVIMFIIDLLWFIPKLGWIEGLWQDQDDELRRRPGKSYDLYPLLQIVVCCDWWCYIGVHLVVGLIRWYDVGI